MKRLITSHAHYAVELKLNRSKRALKAEHIQGDRLPKCPNSNLLFLPGLPQNTSLFPFLSASTTMTNTECWQQSKAQHSDLRCLTSDNPSLKQFKSHTQTCFTYITLNHGLTLNYPLVHDNQTYLSSLQLFNTSASCNLKLHSTSTNPV